MKFYYKTGIVYLAFFQLAACAQTGSLVKNAHSFYTARLPGNIPVGMNGEPLPISIDTTVIIYVETSSKQVAWDTAWKNGKPYKLTAELITQSPFDAGITKYQNEKITLRPAKGSFLWKLQLLPPDSIIAPFPGIQEDGIIIHGKYKGKGFRHKAGSPVELEGIPSV